MPADRTARYETRRHPWLLLALAGVGIAASCTGASESELLAGKQCDPTGACVSGYVCDRRTNVCVLPAMNGPPCTSVADCPTPQSPCESPVCLGGSCGSLSIAPGTALPSAEQASGDCRVVACDASAQPISLFDASDLPVDGDDCTADVCNEGVASNPRHEVGTACGATPGRTCDDAGACVGCLAAADCGVDTVCGSVACVASTCVATPADQGTPLPLQVPGDCRRAVCDGEGAAGYLDDPRDVLDDGQECTVDLCAAGQPSNAPKKDGEPCAAGECNALGQCTGCTTGADCGTDTTCRSFGCADSVCLVVNVESGPAPAEQQVDGDCRVLVCNGAGQPVAVADGDDLPADDGSGCTAPRCLEGTARHDPLPLNTPCSVGGGSVCDGDGACVPCNGASQCAAPQEVCAVVACEDHACTTTSVPSGEPAPPPAQTAGDCQVLICLNGAQTQVKLDPGDVADDGNDCTLDHCQGKNPRHTPAAPGTPCNGGQGTCDGEGVCSG